MKKRLSLLLILSLLTFFAGCEDNENSDPNTDTDSGTDSETSTGGTATNVDIDFTAPHLSNVRFLRKLTLPEIQSTFVLIQFKVPEVAPLVSGLSSAVSVYRLTYQTLYQGAPVQASALVAIPESATPNTPLPVVAFQNGTNTLKAEAPTENPESLFMQMISASASFGYVIAVADYLGFGESAQLVHPYLCRDVTATSLADMLEAIVELEESATPQLPLALSGDLYLLGYSQGGHATMALHEFLERSLDFPLVLQGTAAGAGPYSISDVNSYMLTQPEYPMPYIGAYPVVAFQSMAFLPDDLALYFNAPYAAAIPALFDGTKDADEINAGLTTDLSQMYTSTVIAAATTGQPVDDAVAQGLRSAFDNNSIPGFASATPIRLAHGTADEIIPLSVTQSFQQAMIAAGTAQSNVTVVELPDMDHEEAAPSAVVDAISWFEQLQKQ